MSLDWTIIENALHDWVSVATGLAADAVIWVEQLPPRHARPFETLKLIGLTPDARHELIPTHDPTAPAGAEITLTAAGYRKLGVSVQIYSAAVTGSDTARALLTKAQAQLALPTVQDALRTAGVTFSSEPGITDLSALLDTGFESRAAMTLELDVVDDSASETTTYIESADVEGSAT